MERDFLGLGSKNAPITVKEEVPDSSKDSTPMRGGSMQWSFPNKVSAIPQFLSFKGAADDKPRKTLLDPISSSSFMTISTADAFDSNQKQYSGMAQKNMSLDKQAGNQYRTTNYVVQQPFDGYPVHRTQEMRMFPYSNQQHQTISISSTAPVVQSHFTNSLNSSPLGGVPIVTPVSVVPATSSVIGTTDLRSNVPKSSGKPAQLTIFYGGSVCVYDDISPEKAQAIMLLAGNGSSAAPNVTLTHVRAPSPRPFTADGYAGSMTPSSCSGLTAPISVVSSSSSELAMLKPMGASISSCNQTERPKAVSSIGHGPGAPAVAVPQARKASLARFLEKRKERVTSSSPYSLNKKPSEGGDLGERMV